MIGKGAASLCVLTYNVLLLWVVPPGSSTRLGLAPREHLLPLSKFTHSRALH